MQGRVLIRTQEKAERFNIAWRQLRLESEILLTGPLGASIARLTTEEARYRLDRPNNDPMYAATLDELISNAVGVELPVSSLIPILNGEQKLLVYEDWQLSVAESDQLDRPKLVNITNQATSIRLQVQSWR